jgi:hypothetical protein
VPLFVGEEIESREGHLVTPLWLTRQLEEALSQLVKRAFALVIEMCGALREERAARKAWEVDERGDENTKTAETAATNAHLALNTQEAIKQAFAPLLLLPPKSMAPSPVIPNPQTLTYLCKGSHSKCPGIFVEIDLLLQKTRSCFLDTVDAK